MKKLLLLLVFLPLAGFAQDIHSITHDRSTTVDDYAQAFTADEKARLHQQIKTFFDTVQISVVTVPTIGDADIAESATELANRWGVGSKANNGLLLLIAVKDHKMFAATGKAIQADITDLQAARLQREIAVPLFREGKYYEGTSRLLAAYIDLLSPSAKEYRKAQEALHESEEGEIWTWIGLIVFCLLVIGIPLILLIRRNSRRRREAQEAVEATYRPAYHNDSSNNLITGYMLGQMSNSHHSSNSSSSSSSSSYSSPSSSSSSSSDSSSGYSSLGDSSSSYSSSTDSSSSSSSDFGGGSFDGGGGGSSW